MKLRHWLLLERAIDVVFLLLVYAATWLVFIDQAGAAAQEPPVEVTAVKLYRGSAIIAASDPKHARYVPNFTPDACRIRKRQEREADARARTSGVATYNCQVEERTTVTFIPAPVCAPPRSPQTRQEACPNDPTRTFTQTQVWTIAPHPACEAPGAWLPATPSETDCPPPQLVAPTGVTAAAVSTSEIRIRWNVVPDAVAYSLRRCIGASCDPMGRTPLKCTQSLEERHVTLNPGVTVRYQVEASRRADCSGQLSLPSMPVVSATTFATNPGPELPPTACTSLNCQVDWTHTGPVADGFRIVYGRSENELTRTLQVTPGSVRRGFVTMPEGGVWYFGVIAYIGATASPVSNIVVRNVQ